MDYEEICEKYGLDSLSDANLQYLNIGCAKLAKENLSDINLTGTNLSQSDLSNVNLSYAKLRYARLTDVNLSGADLYGADLSNADLQGANLRGANLIDTNLNNTNLYNAILIDIRINWQSHCLIAELLRQEASDELLKLQICGTILMCRHFCWSDFFKLDHSEKQWALDTLRKLGCPYLD